MESPDNAAAVDSQMDKPAVAALAAWKPAALVDVKWEHDELTLTIAPDDIREAARKVQLAGYNFLEDVTASIGIPRSRASRSAITSIR